ncbi:hypothetical protein [Nonomuraea insulae]|uniref:Uncharacterized protein n=1 Tax=Nonomuraea insulae TaxID=1616787 RepID=A0ABW1D121_9ACTN
MTNDVDTLATALYATTDDMLKEHPDLALWRPPVGITPRLSDAELVTLAMMQAIPGYSGCVGGSGGITRGWIRARWLRSVLPLLPLWGGLEAGHGVGKTFDFETEENTLATHVTMPSDTVFLVVVGAAAHFSRAVPGPF